MAPSARYCSRTVRSGRGKFWWTPMVDHTSKNPSAGGMRWVGAAGDNINGPFPTNRRRVAEDARRVRSSGVRVSLGDADA